MINEKYENFEPDGCRWMQGGLTPFRAPRTFWFGNPLLKEGQRQIGSVGIRAVPWGPPLWGSGHTNCSNQINKG